MKQNVRLFILLAVLLLWSVGCAVVNAGSGTTSSELASSVIASSEAVSSKEVSASSVASEVSASSKSRKLHEAEMSYAEYFSKERVVSFLVRSNLSGFAREDGIYINERLTDGTLRPKRIYEVEIAKHSGDNRQHVFYTTKADPKSLCYYNTDTGFSMKIFTANEEITQISGSWVTLYFTTKSAMYRIHVPTKTVDYIMELPKNFYRLDALSNQQVQYSVYREDWLEYVKETGDHINVGQRKVANYYNYNTVTGATVSFETEADALNAKMQWSISPPSEIRQNPYG